MRRPDTSKYGIDENEGEMDMTSMIDVVFLLIIFFMVVSELTSLQFEPVKLAKAPNAEEYKAADLQKDIKKTIIVNVTQRGEIKVGGTVINKKADDVEAIRSWFKIRVSTLLKRDLGAKPQPVEDLMVLIRGDRMAEFSYVQKVLDACQRIGVYKIQMAGKIQPFTNEGD